MAPRTLLLGGRWGLRSALGPGLGGNKEQRVATSRAIMSIIIIPGNQSGRVLERLLTLPSPICHFLVLLPARDS